MKILIVIYLFLFQILTFAQPTWPEEIPISQQAKVTLKLTGYPDFLAIDVDGVWVTNEDRVEKLVIGNDHPIVSIAMPKPCGAMVTGFGSLWVASCSKKSVYRIDLMSSEITAIIETGLADEEGELSIAIGAGSVWLLTNSAGELSRIDPEKNKVIRKIKVLPHSYATTFGFGALWITNTVNASVQKIDPVKEKVITTIPIGTTPRFITAGVGSIWTLNQDDGSVSRIDPASNSVISTILTEAHGTGGDIATSNSKVYVRGKQYLLSVIDPLTNFVFVRYGPSCGSGAVRIENGHVWVTAHDINTVWMLME